MSALRKSLVWSIKQASSLSIRPCDNIPPVLINITLVCITQVPCLIHSSGSYNILMHENKCLSCQSLLNATNCRLCMRFLISTHVHLLPNSYIPQLSVPSVLILPHNKFLHLVQTVFLQNKLNQKRNQHFEFARVITNTPFQANEFKRLQPKSLTAVIPLPRKCAVEQKLQPGTHAEDSV